MDGRGRTAAAALTCAVLLIPACSPGSGGTSTKPSGQATPKTAAAATAAPPTPSPRDADGCRYVLTRLPAPEGFPYLEPAGSDGHRAIAGTATGGRRDVPVLWLDGRVTRLPTAGGRNGYAVDVNRSGVVVGRVRKAHSFVNHGYIWRNGRAIRLGGNGKPTAIDDAGLVVGAARIQGIKRGVYWWADRPAVRHVIGGLAVDVDTGDLQLTNVNNAGLIVGVGSSAGAERFAISGSVDGLQGMPGIPPGWSEAIDLEGQQLVGDGSYPGHPSSYTRNPDEQEDEPVSWRRDGDRFIALPAGVQARAVNARGLVAAATTSNPGGSPVVIYPEDNRVVELPAPDGSWPLVSDILADGSVVARLESGQGVVWQRRC